MYVWNSTVEVWRQAQQGTIGERGNSMIAGQALIGALVSAARARAPAPPAPALAPARESVIVRSRELV